MSHRIPFNRPYMAGKELYYIAQAVLQGQSAGDGQFTRSCEALMERVFAARRVLLTTSCTTALEMAALLAEIEAGDEVVMPAYTFVSTANAFVLRGARPVFVDVREDTLNLDERALEAAITERTRAIVPVHYAGVACEMDAILEIAARHEVVTIEDAAQGVNAHYRGRALGTLGDMGCYSFHETKNFICGEGGAIVLSGAHAERAEVLREKGTNRTAFFRGAVDKYTWVDIGSSFLPSNLLAAFLYAQLEAMTGITDRRRAIYQRYARELEPLATRGLIQLPTVPEGCETNYHMFFIRTADLETRQALISYLGERGIHAVFHYVPLHTSPMGERLGYRPGMLPVTEAQSERLIRLPFYCELTEADQHEVIQVIQDFYRVR